MIVGENGAGKTNLLEAVHLATQGFSPRTRSELQMVRFGEPYSAVSVALTHQGVAHTLEVRIVPGSGKTASVDGSPLATAETLRRDFPTLVFTPDRLAVIKGGPAVRRAYFDRVLARLYPARAGLSGDYAATLAQRNAALRRVQLGLSPRTVLEPWNARLVELGVDLVEARRRVIETLAGGFAERLDELGLPSGVLRYSGEPPTPEVLGRRLEADIASGVTGAGPHRDDIVIQADGQDLRSFGSQGQQRFALLALILTEASFVPGSPLLLLDDVLSELDAGRRAVLAREVGLLEQTLVTTTHRSALPAEPSQVIEVAGGQAL